MSKKLKQQLWERAEGHCEITGLWLGTNWHAHHRRRKGMGGDSRPETEYITNYMALHPRAHNIYPGSVHQEPAWAEQRGYIVGTNQMPAEIPLLLHGARWVYLTPDGGYELAETPGKSIDAQFAECLLDRK